LNSCSNLENAVALRGGDALVLEDGRLVEVVGRTRAADRDQRTIRSIWCASPGISADRHLPTQITARA